MGHAQPPHGRARAQSARRHAWCRAVGRTVPSCLPVSREQAGPRRCQCCMYEQRCAHQQCRVFLHLSALNYQTVPLVQGPAQMSPTDEGCGPALPGIHHKVGVECVYRRVWRQAHHRAWSPPPDFVRQPIETKDHRDMHCCKSQRAAGGCKGAHSPRRAASAAGSFAWVSLTAVFSLRSVSPSKFAVMTCACAHAASASIHAEQHNRQAGCTHVPALVGRAQQNQVTRDFFVLLQAENVTRPDGPAPSPYQTHRPPALRRGRHSSPPLSSPDHRYSPLCARALGLVSHEEATSTNFPSGASLRTGRALNSWSRR